MNQSFLDRTGQLGGTIVPNQIGSIEQKYLNNGVTEYLLEEYGQQPLSSTISMHNTIIGR